MVVEEIQQALIAEGLDGWLFFDHHRRDPLAYRVLGLPDEMQASRRWYYLIPSKGEPIGMVHQIESGALNTLPGRKIQYSSWAKQGEGLRTLLDGRRVIAMQYSPQCAVPYVSMVDAGTLELVRACGVEVRSSANLIQYFEARWSADQLAMHLEAGKRVDAVRREAFQRIGESLKSGEHITEFDVQQFIMRRFAENGLAPDHGPIVGVNANSSDPHYSPAREGSSAIKPGDFVLIDMWAKLDQPEAVFYDITWTGYCGAEAPSEISNVFGVVSEARNRAIRCVQEAVSKKRLLHGFEVDDAARGYIQEKGFGDYFFHRTGHSIGTNIHGNGANMDNLETHDERTVIASTCFSIEPGVYLKEFGVRSEINMFVGENDARVTGEMQESLLRI